MENLRFIFNYVKKGVIDKYNIEFDVKYKSVMSLVDHGRMSDCCVGVTLPMSTVEEFSLKLFYGSRV